ncbi:MAG TPA: hypothetical protein VGO11_19870 [Chthoniobacteraceae bacterium]|jgi:hypothetical protein|nr:hypothetical protein [Chthoniobacteraceae bacterium]
MDQLMEGKQMEGVAPLDQARKAMVHVLRQSSRENPLLGWFINVGSQSFDLLTEALASIDGVTVREVRERFICRNAEAPVSRDQVKRALLALMDGRYGHAADELRSALGEEDDRTEQEKADDYDTAPERLEDLEGEGRGR